MTPLILGWIVPVCVAALVAGAGFWVFRVKVRADYLRLGRLSIFAAFLQVAAFTLHGASGYFFFTPQWPNPANALPVTLLGYGLMALGTGITLVGMGVLGMRRAVGRQVSGVCQGGLYRWTRNPQIVGYGLLVLGYGLLGFTLWTLAWFALYGLMAHWMVTSEEEHLRRMLGPAYENYCAATPRYFGLPRQA